MFRAAAWMTLIGVVLAGVGCGGEATPPAGDRETVSPDDVKREVTEAANAVKALADDKLSHFKKHVLEWQKDLDAQVEELKEKAEAADDEGERWREISDVFAKKQTVVREKLRALESSSSGTWANARQEADQAMADLKAYLAEQTEKLTKELAETGDDNTEDLEDDDVDTEGS